MATAQALGMLLASLLFSVVGWYLTLIAKFYRLKFSKGPPHVYLQAALAVLVAGLVLKLEFFTAYLPSYVPNGIVCAGGLAFSGLGYALYRTMMSVD